MRWPNEKWSEIVPGLFQGGHVWSVGNTLLLTDMREVRDFDFVFSLYFDDDPQTHPDPGVPHTVWEILDDHDGGVQDGDEAALRGHVDEIVRRLLVGQRVLVRCQLGWNRSGLVVALVLIRLGYRAGRAIDVIRTRRSPDALSNLAFERFIREHEGEYSGRESELPWRSSTPA